MIIVIEVRTVERNMSEVIQYDFKKGVKVSDTYETARGEQCKNELMVLIDQFIKQRADTVSALNNRIQEALKNGVASASQMHDVICRMGDVGLRGYRD